MGPRAAKLILLAVTAAAVWAFSPRPAASAVTPVFEPPQRSRSSARRSPTPKARPPAEPPTFSHAIEPHRRTCSTCHTFPSSNWKTARPADAAFEDVVEFPVHAACLECHRADFFKAERPAPRICSVCHVAVTPKSTVRLPFPSLGAAFWASPRAASFAPDFEVRFPHAQHLEALGAEPANPSATCATCHETYQPQGKAKEEYAVPPPPRLGDAFWLKRGTFKTSPRDHAACFTCHTADSGLSPAPSQCDACHVRSERPTFGFDFDRTAPAVAAVADPLTRFMWSHRGSAVLFRHEGGLHGDLACTACHDVAAMKTDDASTQRVPVKSCGGDSGCHITATSDEGGALTFEAEQRKADPAFVCTKCHLAYGRATLPAAHAAAIAAAKGQ